MCNRNMTNDVLRMTQFHYSFAYIGTRYGFQMPEEVREEREWKKRGGKVCSYSADAGVHDFILFISSIYRIHKTFKLAI